MRAYMKRVNERLCVCVRALVRACVYRNRGLDSLSLSLIVP